MEYIRSHGRIWSGKMEKWVYSENLWNTKSKHHIPVYGKCIEKASHTHINSRLKRAARTHRRWLRSQRKRKRAFLLPKKGDLHCKWMRKNSIFLFSIPFIHSFAESHPCMPHATRAYRPGTLERMKWCWKIEKGNNIPCFGCDFFSPSFVRRAFPIYSNYAKFDFIIISIQFGWHESHEKNQLERSALARIRIFPRNEKIAVISSFFFSFPHALVLAENRLHYPIVKQ